MAQFGIYRGVVMNAMDPAAAGRVQVSVPGISGVQTAWAPVCLAFGAPPKAAPAIGSQVWVAFEAGEPSNPVVLGSIPRH